MGWKEGWKGYSHPHICADYVILPVAVAAKCTGLRGQKLQVTRPHLSLAIRATYALYFLMDYERDRGHGNKMERIICSARRFSLLFFYCGAARMILLLDFRFRQFIGRSIDGTHALFPAIWIAIAMRRQRLHRSRCPTDRREEGYSCRFGWIRNSFCLHRHLRDLKYSWYIRGAYTLQDLHALYPDTRAVITGLFVFQGCYLRTMLTRAYKRESSVARAFASASVLSEHRETAAV